MFTVDEVTTTVKISDIEEYVSQLDIFKHYCPNFKELDKDFVSEFYEDKKPDCRIYASSPTELKYHDFGDSTHLGCYAYVMKKYSCNFRECLTIIANDFNLIKSSNSSAIQPNFMFEREKLVVKPYVVQDKAVISIVSRNWNLSDYHYWFKRYGISFAWLESYNVIPCSYVYLKKGDSTNVFHNSYSNPIYAYKFTDNNSTSFKIYFPLSANKKHKWMFSGEALKSIEGYDQLPEKDEILIITKSLKDVICCRLCGYSAISLQGEGNKLQRDLYDVLKERFKDIIVFYDNDKGGVEGAYDITSTYKIRSITIPLSLESKDLSDLIENKGLEMAKQTLIKLIK